MVTTKTSQEEKKETPKKEKRYYPGIGRRKASVAQVRVYDEAVKKDAPVIEVNGKNFEQYFTTTDLLRQAKRPLELTGFWEKVRVTCVVRGGGLRGQSEAIRLGIARALVNMDENLKPVLKSAKLMTRDARKVERKKPGLKKARRAPQFSKR